jgi:predicted nucleic-acid-binding protein
VRLALDTNVLVRYLTWDDPDQSPRAAHLIESADTIILSTIVLCETVWVLRRAYKFQPAAIIPILRDLTTMPTIELDRPLIEAGIECLATGSDFADGVILAEAERAKADHLVTFDETLAKHTTKIRLL